MSVDRKKFRKAYDRVQSADARDSEFDFVMDSIAPLLDELEQVERQLSVASDDIEELRMRLAKVQEKE